MINNNYRNMKNICLVAALIFLFLIGCSSTYRVSDFSSKDKFYEDFDKSMHNKSFKVVLLNDSSFIITGNVKISNDSLILLNPGQNAMNNLSLEQVKKVSSIYKGNNRFTGLWIGGVSSFLLSYIIISINYQPAHNFHNYSLPPFPASLGIGALGGIIGYIIGAIYDRPCTYEFNP